MSVINETLQANKAYASQFNLANLPIPPGKNLAVVACMDARVTVEDILGLKTGDAHIIRNAGGIVTDDALRSLIISSRLLGTREFIIMNHTDCGMLTFKDDEVRDRLVKETGVDVASPAAFHAHTNLEENVLRQISKVKNHPWLEDSILVRGFIFDVKTGALNEVK